MKFTVEIEDFWLDEEEELAPTLRKHIVNDVVSKINKQIENKVEDTITRQVKQQVQQQLLEKTNRLIDEFIEKGEIQSGISGHPGVSVEEYIKEQFNRKSGWGNPAEKMAKIAERLGNQLKERYDLLFATHVVKKLDKEGLLKENVAKMILDSNS